MSNLPMPTSAPVVHIDLTSLTLEDMRLGDDFLDAADLTAEQRTDPEGDYLHVAMVPRPGMPKWIAAIIGLPRVEFVHGIEWIELEVWNPGVPVRIVIDAKDRDTDCFEIAFCKNDTVWTGWQTFRVRLDGPNPSNPGVSKDGPILLPVRIKWMIVIMRQGLPWQLGFRALRIKPLKEVLTANRPSMAVSVPVTEE